MKLQSLKRLAVFVIVQIGLISASFAQDANLGKLTISNAYIKETVAGQTVASAFLKIKNAGTSDKLVSASSATGSEVQLHTMKMEGNVMKMTQIPSIDIA
jgi:hypothetical protein